MKHAPFMLAGICCVTLCAGSAAIASGDDMLSGEEVKKLVDAGKYRDALKSLQRILALKGAFAANYDRYDMLMLAGECELQIRESHAALLSFTEAHEQAFAEKKPGRAGPPAAMMELILRAPAYIYKPRGGGAPIPLLDLAKRKEAFAALLADELPAVKARAALLGKATALGPVLETAKAVGTMRAVEMAATNDSTRTDEMVTAVVQQVGKLITPVLADYMVQQEAIAKQANELITENVPKFDQANSKTWLVQKTHKRGPSPDHRRALKEMGATCEKISAATKSVATALGTELEAMAELDAKATTVRNSAAGLLLEDYSIEVKQ